MAATIHQIEMRQQDVSILRQLNQIQQTIHILGVQRRPRTFSASSLTSPDADRAQDVTSEEKAKARTLHRLNSLPVNTRQESFDDVVDDDYDDDDVLGESFDSAVSDPPVTHQSVHALCTLPRSRHPRLGQCVWPSIPEQQGDSRPGTPSGHNTPAQQPSPVLPSPAGSIRSLYRANPDNTSSDDPFQDPQSPRANTSANSCSDTPSPYSGSPCSQSLESYTSSRSFSPSSRSQSGASYTLPSPDLPTSIPLTPQSGATYTPTSPDMAAGFPQCLSVGSTPNDGGEDLFTTRFGSSSSYQSSVFQSNEFDSLSSQDSCLMLALNKASSNEARNRDTSVDSTPSPTADTNSPRLSPQRSLPNKTISSITGLDMKTVIRRRQASDYEVSYEKLLKRSSQIWKEVQTQQEGGGKVDEKKMAALKLFL